MSKNASFFENIFPYKTREVDQFVTKQTLDDTSLNDQQEDESEQEPRRSKRARIEKSFVSDFLTYMLEDEPLTYNEAIRSFESTF